MKTPKRLRSSRRASRIEVLESRLTPGGASATIPHVLSISPASTPSDTASVTYTVTFDQAVVGVDAADFHVVTDGDAKASATVAVSGTGATRSVVVSGLQGNGDVRLDLVDDNSIMTNVSGAPEQLPLGGFTPGDGSFVGQTFHLLQTMPKVNSITGTAPLNLSGTTAEWTVTFSENVTGVDDADFTLVFSGATSAMTGPTVTQTNASTYKVTATGLSGSGSIGLNLVDNGTIKDSDNNPLQMNPVAVSTPYSQSVGSYPVEIAAGDLNGDGKADVVVANYNSNTVSVLLGNGDGSFQTRQDFATLSRPRSVAIGDVNGDGKPDIAVNGSGYFSGFFNVSVLLGNGDGTFQSHQDFGDYESSRAVAIADVTGDGRPDLVVTSASGIGHVNVLVGNGNGTFQSPVKYSVGSEPRSVAVGDLDGDGDLDVTTANFNDNNVTVLLNNGNGTFGSSTTFVTGFAPLDVALGDVNGDSKLDIVTANNSDGTVSVLIGSGSGSFGAKTDYSSSGIPSTVALTDVNGDGKLDLVVTEGVFGPSQPTSLPEQLVQTTQAHIFLGAGDGTFGTSIDIQVPGGNVLGLVIADLNGDGKADGGGSDSSFGSVGTLLNSGNGNFIGDVFTLVQPDPYISSISDGVSSALAGDVLTFTIYYGNQSDASATGVVLTLPLDSHYFFVASENPGWTESNGVLTKSLGTLNAFASSSASLTLHVDYAINGYASGLAQVTISNDNGDAIDKNNSSTDYTGIEGNYNGFVVTAPGIAPKNKFAPPIVQVYDRLTGDLIYSIQAYETNYRDSVRVAVGDFNRDGIDDIVTTTQHNGGRMRFFDGSTGRQFTEGPLSEEIPVFGTSKNKGAFVAVGNVSTNYYNNQASPENLQAFDYPEIIVGSSLISATVGGGTVKVYSLDASQPNAQPEQGPGGPVTLQVIKEFKPFGAGFKGGVRVAVGDVDLFGNGEKSLPENGERPFLDDDIVVGQGYRGNTVKVYKGADVIDSMGEPVPMGTFKVGSSAFKGGVSVALGDINDDGHADIIVGRNTGAPSVVQIFSGRTILPNTTTPDQIGADILPFDSSYRFGVRVASADVNGDGVADIIASVGIKNQSRVQFYVSTFQSGTGEVQYVLDPDRTITAYSEFPNVALWVAGSQYESLG